MNFKISLATDSYQKWVGNTSLPYNSASHQSILHNNFIYLFGGGDDTTYHQDISRALMLPNGSLSTWEAKGYLPATYTWYSTSNLDNDVYLLGGAKPNPSIPTISSVDWAFHAKIDEGGNINSWIQQPGLPTPRSRGGSFIYKNRIYYIGGLTHATNSTETVASNVYYSNLNQDGSIASWSQTNALPQPRAEFALFLWKNYVFIVGGYQNGSQSQPVNTNYRGEINQQDGSIIWTSQTNLPKGLRRPAYTQRNDKLYIIGGYDGDSFTSGTYSADILESGTVSNWSLLEITLPIGSCCNSAISTQSNIYLLGSHDGLSYYSNTYSSKITSYIDVPNLKQFFTLWKDITYDNAQIWSPSKTSIERWGCALTSAAMVLSYHGHTITPDTLNTYLLNNNGYTRNGGVVWGKISKYTKDHETSTSPSLEFERSDFSQQSVKTNVENQIPTIIQLKDPLTQASHFVVAKRSVDNDFTINDPATNETLLSHYPPDSYSTANTFIPSHTDLSSINLYINSNSNLAVTGPKNGFYFLEPPLEDQIEHISANSENLKGFYLAKPSPGKYYIEVTGNSPYRMDSYLLDKNGNSKDGSFEETINMLHKDYYQITIGQISDLEKVNFDFLLKLIDIDYKNSLIKNKTVYNSLKSLVLNSHKQYKNKKILISKTYLAGVLFEVKAASKVIDKEASIELQKIVNLLLETLN